MCSVLILDVSLSNYKYKYLLQEEHEPNKILFYKLTEYAHHVLMGCVSNELEKV